MRLTLKFHFPIEIKGTLILVLSDLLGDINTTKYLSHPYCFWRGAWTTLPRFPAWGLVRDSQSVPGHGRIRAIIFSCQDWC